MVSCEYQYLIYGIDRSDPFAALQAALADPPLLCTDKSVKATHFETVSSILMAIKDKSIEEAAKKLTVDEIDVLFKYLYHGFEVLTDQKDCGQFLKWHNALSASGNRGSIVRCLTDRRLRA